MLKITNIPVKTGLKQLDSIKNEDEVILSESHVGIPCLIANGMICDLSGNPYNNNVLQNEFSVAAKRILDCKCIAICKLVSDTDDKLTNESPYQFSYASSLNARSSFSRRIIENTRLIVEDVIPTLATNMRYEHRRNMITSIISGIVKENPDLKLSMNQCIRFDKKDGMSERFAYKNAMSGNLTEVRYMKESYENMTKSFILDPFSLITAKVDSMRISNYTDMVTKKKIDIIDSLTIKYKNESIRLSMSSQKAACNILLLKAIREKILSTVTVRAVERNNKLFKVSIL